MLRGKLPRRFHDGRFAVQNWSFKAVIFGTLFSILRSVLPCLDVVSELFSKEIAVEKVRISKECLQGIISSTSKCILPVLSRPYPVHENYGRRGNTKPTSEIPPVFEMLLHATSLTSKAFHSFA